MCLIYFSGIVGEISEDGNDFFIWTHKKFDIGFNGKQIVDVNLTSDNKVKLEIGAEIGFSYEVRYKNLNVKGNLTDSLKSG
jgi:transmembrane 9 superfamily protein 3